MGNFKNADRLDSASLVKARQCRARGLPSPGFYAAGEKSPCRQARIDTQIVLRTMRIPPLAKFAAGASPLPYSAVRKRSVYSKKQRKQICFLCFRSLFLAPEGRQRRTKLVFLHNISSPIKYDKISSTVQQGRPLRPPNINIIPHLLFSVNSPDIQTFPLLFMKVPILQKGRTVGIIKLPQRSDSNVQVTL